MYAPDSWYEPDTEHDTPADYGWVREDETLDVDYCKSMLQNIIESVYITGDIKSFEKSLEELTNEFNINIPDSEPVLEKKKTNHLMYSYLEYQKSYINNMNTTRR